MPGFSGEPRGDYARVLCFFRTRGCGCNGHPAFPTPSVVRGGGFLGMTRALCVAGMRGGVSKFGCLKFKPRCHRPRRRAIQYSEASMMESIGRGVLDTPPSRGMTSRCERGYRLLRRADHLRGGDLTG